LTKQSKKSLLHHLTDPITLERKNQMHRVSYQQSWFAQCPVWSNNKKIWKSIFVVLRSLHRSYLGCFLVLGHLLSEVPRRANRERCRQTKEMVCILFGAIFSHPAPLLFIRFTSDQHKHHTVICSMFSDLVSKTNKTQGSTLPLLHGSYPWSKYPARLPTTFSVLGLPLFATSTPPPHRGYLCRFSTLHNLFRHGVLTNKIWTKILNFELFVNCL